MIVKSEQDLWAEAEKLCPEGFCAAFDANGVSTLAATYGHLARCGRLVTYGFHSNLPMGAHRLNPLQWASMIFKMARMPRFDPMDMVLQSKAVLGFNLSFFASELGIIEAYMAQLEDWIREGAIEAPAVTVMPMEDIAEAHTLIQSGSSVGKIVLSCDAASPAT